MKAILFSLLFIFVSPIYRTTNRFSNYTDWNALLSTCLNEKAESENVGNIKQLIQLSDFDIAIILGWALLLNQSNQLINKCIGYWKTKEKYADELMDMWMELALCTKDKHTLIPAVKETFAKAIRNKDIAYISNRFFIQYGSNMNIYYPCKDLLKP